MSDALAGLVEANVTRAEWTKTSAPAEGRCLKVERISPHGPAGRHGVEAGNLVVEIDGFPGFECGLEVQSSPKAPTRYDIWHQGRQELLKLEVTGIDIGVVFKPTIASILERYNPAAGFSGEPEDLVDLWQVGEWDSLHQLALATVGVRKTGGLLGLFAKETPRRDVNHPALLFLGAALFEKGERAQGLEYVLDYKENFARFWTMEYHAVAACYLAEGVIAKGDQERGLELLGDAFQMDPRLTRIADRIVSLGGTPPAVNKPWQGKSFPVSYDLPSLDEEGTPRYSLASALQALDEHQLLIVCLLATYRGNGPYDDFQNRFKHISAYMKSVLPMMHVVTASNERREDRPNWYRAEDRNRKDGLPFHVLHESDEAVTKAVMPHGSPWLMLLDKTGLVRYEGILTSVDLWDTLAGL